MKTDCLEVPHCVYNEWVASRLGMLAGAPVACGGLIVTESGLAYASVRLKPSRDRRRALTQRDLERIANACPAQVAALVGLDIWIGNYDRAANFDLAATTTTSSALCGYDHSQALLDCRASAADSLAALRSKSLLVTFHPFFGLVQADAMREWLAGIQDVHGSLIRRSCVGEPINAVGRPLQEALAAALIDRKCRLHELVFLNRLRVFSAQPEPERADDL